jgi:DNA-binding XRE family transcriptional regulator
VSRNVTTAKTRAAAPPVNLDLLSFPDPTPAQIIEARQAIGWTQDKCAAQVGVRLRTWAAYEAESGPNHRRIPIAAWTLFLLATGQHEEYKLFPAEAVVPIYLRAD